VAFGWVQRAAELLANEAGVPAQEVSDRFRRLIAEMADRRTRAGPLAEATDHFREVTGNYWPGLFHCYAVPDLPRTNNDLEQLFGSTRHHERRVTGRKVASRTLVVRGEVRLLAAFATRQMTWDPEQLRPTDLKAWEQLRQRLEHRHAAGRAQYRFRRDSAAYLAKLEDQLLQLVLPP
jgi:hypothetical protein